MESLDFTQIKRWLVLCSYYKSWMDDLVNSKSLVDQALLIRIILPVVHLWNEKDKQEFEAFIKTWGREHERRLRHLIMTYMFKAMDAVFTVAERAFDNESYDSEIYEAAKLWGELDTLIIAYSRAVEWDSLVDGFHMLEEFAEKYWKYFSIRPAEDRMLSSKLWEHVRNSWIYHYVGR